MHHLLEKPGVEFIWLIDDNLPGVIEQRNAYYSIVTFVKDGIEITTVVENDEFEVTGQIGYETD